MRFQGFYHIWLPGIDVFADLLIDHLQFVCAEIKKIDVYGN